MSVEKFVEGPLMLELEEGAKSVSVVWRGRSIARDPGSFIVPILTRALEAGEKTNKRVVLDFRALEYLNSSTLTPVIRIIEQANRGQASMSVLYNGSLKWQALAFSALHLFGTSDSRVSIQGA